MTDIYTDYTSKLPRRHENVSQRSNKFFATVYGAFARKHVPYLEFVGAAILDAEYVNTSGMVAPSMSGNQKHTCSLNWTLCVRVFCGLALSLKSQIILSTVVASMQQRVYGTVCLETS